MEFFAQGIDDLVLYLPDELIPRRKVLLLRYKNRYESLAEALTLKGIEVRSMYPVTWQRKEWNAQEERMAKDIDGNVHSIAFIIFVH